MMKLFIIVIIATGCIALEPRIKRPCKDLADLSCIRQNIKESAVCEPAYGSLPNKLEFTEFAFNTPYFNSSYIDYDLVMSNIENCFVTEFYFNLDSGNAVLAVQCDNLNLVSERRMFQHIRGRESWEFNYHCDVTYPSISMTLTLHKAHKINFCRDNYITYTYVPQLPIYNISPKDKPTANALTQDLTDLYIYEKESMNVRGRVLMDFIMTQSICDFGCKLPYF